MKIPESFRKAQAIFQDKVIEYHPAVKTEDEDGHIHTNPGEKVSNHDVNVQILNDTVIAQEYGLEVGRDIFVTSSKRLDFKHGDYIVYNGDTYKISGIIANDSHDKVYCEKV